MKINNMRIKLLCNHQIEVLCLYLMMIVVLFPCQVFAQFDMSHTNQPRVLLVRGDASIQPFNDVILGIKDELSEDLNLVEIFIGQKKGLETITTSIEKIKPKLLVLIGNTAINVYSSYQRQNNQKYFPPAVALAALNVDQIIDHKLENAMGIRYEIPANTSIVNMRSLMRSKIKKVGVIHREWMNSFIQENAKYCFLEGVELISYQLPNNNKVSSRQIKLGIRRLVKKEEIDALWVVNDNALLSGSALRGWFAGLKKINIPVIVNIKELVDSEFDFGSYAIVPDNYALGVQGASMILDIMENDWEIGQKMQVEPPISVKKILNLKLFKQKKIQYNIEKLDELDSII